MAFALSVTTIPDIILHGGLCWKLGDITIFRSSHLGRSIAFALLSLFMLVWMLHRPWHARFINLLSLRGWLFGILLAVAGYAGISGLDIVHGDGCEYILQTQAMVFDGTVAINPETRKSYWNETNPYGLILKETKPPAIMLSKNSQAGGGFGGLYPDRFGDYRYYHFWVYSAAVAPVYLLFHLFDPAGNLEYFSFRFTNVCLLLGFFFFAFRQKPSWTALVILFLLLFSPLIPYCDWQHPEIFCMALVFIAFHLTSYPKAALASPILLGLAASMNLPILLFFPCHFIFSLLNMDSRRAGSIAKLVAGYTAGAAVGLSSSAYYLYYFHTPSVIASVGGASLGNASFSRVVDIFFSPLIGAALFFPLSLFAIPACVTRRNLGALCMLLASVVAATWLASSTSNFNSGQVGTVRYAIWLLSPLWFYLFRYVPETFSFRPRGWFLGAALCIGIFLIFYLRTYELFGKDTRRFEGSWRAHPEVAALMRVLPYDGDVEVLVENILGREPPGARWFNDIYIWDLGHDHCLWILPECTLSKQRPLVVQTDGPNTLSISAGPRQPILIRTEGTITRIEIADPPPRLYRHPMFGNYLVLRSKGKITQILKNQRFVIRSDTIRQVDSIGTPGPDPDRQGPSGEANPRAEF